MDAEPQISATKTCAALKSPPSHHTGEPILMDTSEVATMLNMSTSWVYREASKLGLKGYKLGRGKNAKVLYRRSQVFKWLEQQKVH
ncbi:helix-turn-helix domain-containing protein [Streptomyces sp. NBC_00820]|uniref:helix-turn-helix domain-containing protein n=1 Tax=Streptomyces sp. NBC_00820 TaxID=2975842 RepID=UPI002ED53C29|nr:helix-turn-helix domain-containing protein [Streptomyces sp. NBC_00820]